jgi:hypothetical protein
MDLGLRQDRQVEKKAQSWAPMAGIHLCGHWVSPEWTSEPINSRLVALTKGTGRARYMTVRTAALQRRIWEEAK